MDYGALPPEINSARMYFGPGSGPMLAAASAWAGLAAELHSTASTYQSMVVGLTSEGWLGPASASMAAAVAPYMTWMNATSGQAEQTSAQASAAAAAYETAFAMTVPPPVVAANRAQLATLVATNFLGINTAAIAATEAEYAEMWAQDAAAMYGYAANSSVASELKQFAQPPETTNSAGRNLQSEAVSAASGAPAASGAQETLTQLTSALPSALQSLASPLASASSDPLSAASSVLAAAGFPTDLWTFLDSNFVNGFVSAGYTSPAILQQTVTAAMADINAVAVGGEPGATALPPMGAGSGNAGWTPLGVPGMSLGAADLADANFGVSAQTARGMLVGRLSVPQAWTTVAQVQNGAGATFAGGGWTNAVGPAGSSAVPAGMPGMPGMPLAAGGHGGFGHGPRYGFRPTVMPRPPAAG